MIDVAKKVVEAVEKNIKVWPRDVNWASDAGHPCVRYLVFSRIAWQMKVPPDTTLQFIFKRGAAAEAVIDEELKLAGFKIVEHGRPYEDESLKIRGKIDRKLEIDGVRVPVEYKTVSPREIDHINSVEDMIAHDKVYIRQWPAQLLLYMLMSGSDLGLFYLKNSLTWYPKSIWVTLAEKMPYVYGLIDKLREVNYHAEKGIVPEIWPADISICDRCGFFLPCEPIKHFGAEAQIMLQTELEDLLDERGRLQDSYKRYGVVDKQVKEQFEGVEKAICGHWLIEGKEQAMEVKPQTARTNRFWKLKIERIGE
jgi:hypothetical protein